jgi:hypothetical protein
MIGLSFRWSSYLPIKCNESSPFPTLNQHICVVVNLFVFAWVGIIVLEFHYAYMESRQWQVLFRNLRAALDVHTFKFRNVLKSPLWLKVYNFSICSNGTFVWDGFSAQQVDLAASLLYNFPFEIWKRIFYLLTRGFHIGVYIVIFCTYYFSRFWYCILNILKSEFNFNYISRFISNRPVNTLSLLQNVCKFCTGKCVTWLFVNQRDFIVVAEYKVFECEAFGRQWSTLLTVVKSRVHVLKNAGNNLAISKYDYETNALLEGMFMCFVSKSQ